MTSLVLFLLIGTSLSSSLDNIFFGRYSLKDSGTLQKYGSADTRVKSVRSEAVTVDRTQEVSTAITSSETQNNAAPSIYTVYLDPFNLYKDVTSSFYWLLPSLSQTDKSILLEYITVYPATKHNPHFSFPRTGSLRYCSFPLIIYPGVHNERSLHMPTFKEPLKTSISLKRIPDGTSHNFGTNEGLIEPTFAQNPLPSAQPIFPFRPIDFIDNPVVSN